MLTHMFNINMNGESYYVLLELIYFIDWWRVLMMMMVQTEGAWSDGSSMVTELNHGCKAHNNTVLQQ